MTLVFAFNLTANAQYYDWVGGFGENWDEPNNWEDENGDPGVPQDGSDVYIYNGFVIYQGDLNFYNIVEISGGSDLLIQGDLNVSDLYVDDISGVSVDIQSLSQYSKIICDYYSFEGNIDLLFGSYIPQIGDTFKTVQGDQDVCSISTTEFVPDTQVDGTELTFGVQCQTDGILHTLTGINYTTAKYWTGNGGDNLWGTATNWNNSILPDANSIVIINLPSGANVNVGGAGTISVNSISISDGNTLSISGGTLETIGVINNTDSAVINWNGGSLSESTSPTSGFLWNFGTLNINTSALKSLENGFQISNQQGFINHNDGDLNLNNGQVVMFSGDYNINADNITIGYDGVSAGSHNFFLLGGATLRKNTGSGSGTSTIDLPNFSAFTFSHIISEEGTLAFNDFNFNFTSFEGSGQFQLPSSQVVKGDISPGSSPGILTFVGDLTTSSTADFNIEIEGSTAGTDYDKIVVTNSATLEGNINVTLGYAPANNASFEILTATTLNSCNFPAQVIANYLGTDYTFDIVCNGTSLFLNAPGVLSTEDEEIQGVSIYPNPASDFININSNNILGGSWKVYNQLGQIMKQGELGELQTRINVKELNAGLYFIEIQGDNNIRTSKKIIIN